MVNSMKVTNQGTSQGRSPLFNGMFLAAMLLLLFATVSWADVKITIGPTPIPSGDAVGKGDITLQNSRLAVSFAVETAAPWGVAKGGILDVGIVRDGKLEMDRATLIDFIPNNWSSWPTTYQNITILKDTPEEGVVQTVRDWERCELKTTYALKKGENRIHMLTTMTNQGDSVYTDLLSGYVLWTDGGHLFTTPGLAGIKKGTTEAALADWVVNYDENWAVGIHAPYFDFINYHARDMYKKHTLTPKKSRTFEGWVQIDGDGDISSMLAFEMERKQLASGVVVGKVTTEDGTPVSDPVIVVEKDDKTYAWTLGKSGSYKLELPEGTYEIYAAGKSYASSSKQQINIQKGQSIDLDFVDMKYPGQITFMVSDKKSFEPLDARISIEKGETPVVGFLGKKTFFTALDKIGELKIDIAPGKYVFKVAHGESFVSKAVTVDAAVASNEHQEVSVAVERELSLADRGWYSCDMHHHSNLLDGVTPPEYVVRSQLAAALDFTLLSDHDLVKNNEIMQKMSRQRRVNFIPSIEISPSWAHFNAFPVQPGKTLGIDPGTATVQEVFAAARDMGAMAISANHPYIPYGYFHSLDNESVPGGFDSSFDLVELNAACKYKKTIKRIWGLWNEGTRYYLSGGTDTHDVWKDVSGKLRMVVKIDGEPTPEKFVSGLLDGEAYASFGPVVESSIPFGREVKLTQGSHFRLNCRVSAVEGLKEVQLVSQGEVVENIVLEQGEVEKKISFETVPEKDTWYALTVSDSKDNMAWTNPIWVDMVAYTKTPADLK